MDSTIKYVIDESKRLKYIKHRLEHNPLYEERIDPMIHREDDNHHVVQIEYFTVKSVMGFDKSTFIFEIENECGEIKKTSLSLSELNDYFTQYIKQPAPMVVPAQPTSVCRTDDEELFVRFFLSSRSCKDLRNQARERFNDLMDRKASLESSLQQIKREFE